MVESTRRSFLAMAGAGAASVGAVAIGGAALGENSSERTADSVAAGTDGSARDSFVVHVKDVGQGRMSILSGESEVLLEDRALAAQLAAATR